jgi:hypothetical protein
MHGLKKKAKFASKTFCFTSISDNISEQLIFGTKFGRLYANQPSKNTAAGVSRTFVVCFATLLLFVPCLRVCKWVHGTASNYFVYYICVCSILKRNKI